MNDEIEEEIEVEEETPQLPQATGTLATDFGDTKKMKILGEIPKNLFGSFGLEDY